MRLLLLLVSIAAFQLYSQEVREHRMFVTGNSHLHIPADNAQFTFSVKGTASTLRGAVEEAKRKISIISGKLIKIGIKEQGISTSSFFSSENFSDKAFLSSSRDYQASMSVSVILDSLTVLESALFIVSEHQIETISNIEFSLSNDELATVTAISLALQKAKEKAKSIADQMNITLGKIITIDEQAVYVLKKNEPALHMGIRGGRAAESSVSGFPFQTLDVEASIRVVYEIP